MKNFRCGAVAFRARVGYIRNMAPQFDGAVEYEIEEEEDPAQNRCGGEPAATDNRMTRMRQVTASRKTTNLSLRALEPKKQCLDQRPARGAGQVLFFGAPWSGFVERPWIRRSVFLRIDRRRFSRPLWVAARRTTAGLRYGLLAKLALSVIK